MARDFFIVNNSKKITYISVVVDHSDPPMLRLQHAGADRAREFALHRRFNPYEVALEEAQHIITTIIKMLKNETIPRLRLAVCISLCYAPAAWMHYKYLIEKNQLSKYL
jgi:hypothetical protein